MLREYFRNPIRMNPIFYALIAAVAILFATLLSTPFVQSLHSLSQDIFSEYDYIVIADIPQSEHYYLNFNGQGLLLVNEKVMFADIWMYQEDADYPENLTALSDAEILQSNTCAVSINLMLKYGLKIGDNVLFDSVSADLTFQIVRELPILHGMDPNYSREGVVLLGNTEGMGIPQNIVSFNVGGGAFINSVVIAKKDLITQNALFAGGVCLGYWVVLLGMMLAIEILFEKHRKETYLLFHHAGMKKFVLGGAIFTELLLKYAVLPCFIGLITAFFMAQTFGAYALFGFLIQFLGAMFATATLWVKYMGAFHEQNLRNQ